MKNLQKNTNKKSKLTKYKPLYFFVKVTGALPCLIAFRPKLIIKGDIKDLHKRGGVLISSNHRSFLDVPQILCAFGLRNIISLATSELFDGKFKNWFFNNVNCIPVERNNFSIDSFHLICDYLKDDRAVLIFPEGSINAADDSSLNALKSGVVLMAHKANKPILPIYVAKKRKWYNRTTIIVGEPIYVRDICGNMPSMAALNKVSNLLKDKENSLKNDYLKEEKR